MRRRKETAPWREWTEKEKADLRRLYPVEPLAVVYRAIPRHTPRAIRQKAHRLGLQTPYLWTREDDVLLRELWPEHSRRTILERFPSLTWNAIAKHAARLGLSAVRFSGYATLATAARAIGIDRMPLRRAIVAYQRHYATIPLGAERDALPSPSFSARVKSRKGAHVLVDMQAAIDAVVWWDSQEDSAAAARRHGMPFTTLRDALKRAREVLPRYTRRPPAWWDAFIAANRPRPPRVRDTTAAERKRPG